MAYNNMYWCREKTALLQERNFLILLPLIEMKRLLKYLNRFRNEEVPPRQRDKQKVFQIYKELEKYFESIGEVEVDSELRPDSIEKAWHRLQSAMADRDQILQQEVQRLERLQRIADKVQREIKHTDSRLSDLEHRISEEARRIERLHPIDAKNIVEALETEIRHLEQPIQEMNDYCCETDETNETFLKDLKSEDDLLIVQYKQPLIQYKQPLVQYKRPLVEYKRPLVEYKRPLVEYKRPLVEYKRPLDEYKRALDEYKRPLDEYKQPLVEYKRPLNEYKTAK